MLTMQQIQSCRSELLNRQEEITEHIEDHFGINYEFIKESISELSSYDNHPGDHGTELFERQKDIALNEHIEKELKDIKEALNAINDGTYGKCEVCDADIPADRMLAMPTTKTCINHVQQNVKETRPVEEDVIPANLNDDLNQEEASLFDAEDAWQAVEQYGSSDSPSDFFDTDKSYNNLYFNSDESVGSVEDLEGFLLCDMNGNYIGVNEEHEHYEDYLDDNDVGSILYTDR